MEGMPSVSPMETRNPMETKPLPTGRFEKELDFTQPRKPREWMQVLNGYVGKNVYSLEFDDRSLAKKTMGWAEFKKLLDANIFLMGATEETDAAL
jgi:hypothetical protein